MRRLKTEPFIPNPDSLNKNSQVYPLTTEESITLLICASFTDCSNHYQQFFKHTKLFLFRESGYGIKRSVFNRRIYTNYYSGQRISSLKPIFAFYFHCREMRLKCGNEVISIDFDNVNFIRNPSIY